MAYENEPKKHDLFKEVAALIKQGNDSHKALEEAEAQLRHDESRLEDKSSQLDSVSRELSVTKRKIKDLTNDLFRIKNLSSRISSQGLSMAGQIEAAETEQAGLEERLHYLHEKSAEVERNMKEDSDLIAGVEQQMSETGSTLEDLVARKQEMSGEIASLLAKASEERKDVDSELEGYSINLLDAINERFKAKKDLTELESRVKEIRKRIEPLEAKCLSLEKRKALEDEYGALKEEVDGLDGEIETINSSIKAQQDALSEKQQASSKITKENVDRLELIAPLEQEVGPYEQIVLKVSHAENNRTQSSMFKETSLQELEALLKANTGLERQLRFLEEKAKIIKKAIKETIP